MVTKTSNTNSTLISILVTAPVDKAYTYAIPSNTATPEPGSYCFVPFGKRIVPGVVWGYTDSEIPPKNLKYIEKISSALPMPEIQRKFIDWVAAYTMSPRGSVLKMSLSITEALEEEKGDTGYKLAGTFQENEGKGNPLTEKQKAVIRVLGDGKARKTSELSAKAGCSPGVIRNMEDKEMLAPVRIYAPYPCKTPEPDKTAPELSETQQKAANDIRLFLDRNNFSVGLLDGVTGSGKTEVYFEGVAQTIKKGKQVLILLPEIALSESFISRFEKRFGCKPGIWHFGISRAQKKRTWKGVADGKTKVVIGARSALFLPFKNPGLIIVDEEHDPAYKQEDKVFYNARDMAVVRAMMGDFQALLVSATPSLETMANVWSGKYQHFVLHSRYGGAEMPSLSLVDMRENKTEQGFFISNPLFQDLVETKQNGLQSLLYLNRRGFAPLTLCRACGHRFECPRCTAWLVEHKKTSSLNCHHCNFLMRFPDECPSCHSKNSLVPCGPGVERIIEELKQRLPQARMTVLSSDTVENHKDLQNKLDEIRSGNVDIIVGTQIVAKGHHFPKLACVGIIDSDLGLSGGDLRAAERTYQVLSQVSGRAGREKFKGHVYLQTYMPEHPVMQALLGQSRDRFLEVEAGQRRDAGMPPYTRLSALIISSTKENELDLFCRNLASQIPSDLESNTDIKILGPAVAPIARIRGRFRRRFLILATKKFPIQKALRQWLDSVKYSSHIRVLIDIDPQSFF